MLYLETQDSSKREIAKNYQKKLLELCGEKLVEAYLSSSKDTNVPSSGNFDSVTKWLQSLAVDLDHYPFVKRLWQQTLTYACYHAKALEEPTASQSSAGEGG